MPQPGYQEGGERIWWWKVAQHLDDAQRALVNAMAHNLDEQAPVFALQDKLREAQAMLLEIFRGKGLLPATTNGASNGASAEAAATAAPSEVEQLAVETPEAEIPVVPQTVAQPDIAILASPDAPPDAPPDTVPVAEVSPIQVERAVTPPPEVAVSEVTANPGAPR